MNQTAIGSYIARKRKEQNLTQEQLAQQLGVSNKTISKWENGESQPDLATLAALCDIFHVSADELLRETPPTPSPAAAVGLKEILLLILTFCASMLVLGCLTLILLNCLGPCFGITEVILLFLLQLGLSSAVVYQVYKRLSAK